MEESLQVYPNQIKQGDYVKFKINDTDTLRTYLIKSQIEKKHGYDEGIFEECNYVLKWMYNGKLYSYPCIVINNTKYTGGTKTEVVGFTETSAMMGILIQKNIDTKTITNNQRILLMDNAWRVTLNDNVTMNGLLSLSLGKDSINIQVDDVENEIADRWANDYSITLSSTTQTLEVGSTYQMNCTVTNNGKQVSNPNITYTSSDTNIATVSDKGLITSLEVGNCNITASIGSVVAILNLTVNSKTSTNVTSYSCDWSTGETVDGVSLKIYMSSLAKISKTINSVIDSSLDVTYTLNSVGTDLITNKLISITKQSNNTFLVKNLKVNTVKNFNIQFINNSDGSVITTQKVSLSGM
jgi:uncharacterized protein YjdB